MLSSELIKELRMIIKEDYGKDFSQQEAFELGKSLVDTFIILLKTKKNNKLGTDENDYAKSKTI